MTFKIVTFGIFIYFPECSGNFKNAINVAEGHFCEPHNDCLGLSCTLNVVMGFVGSTDRFELRFDKCRRGILVKMFGVKKEIGIECE